MEENKVKNEASKKLTYEQLEAYCNQIVTKAQALVTENSALKQELNGVLHNNGIAEINLALKCLELKENFSPEFITAISKRVEEMLIPEQPKEEDNVSKQEAKLKVTKE